MTVALMGAAATPPLGNWQRLLLAGGAMLFTQFLIGVTNDLWDQELDAGTKPWKPLPSGRVRPSHAWGLAGLLLAMATILVVPLGALPAGLLAVIASALILYNLKLKRSRWSWTPFAVFFPLLPLYAWTAVGHPVRTVALIIPLGALLGVSVHLANSTPDVEGDRRYEAGGLAVWLGRDRSITGCWILSGTTQIAAIVAGIVAGLHPIALAVGTAGSALFLVGAILVLHPGREGGDLQIHFVLIALSATMLGLGWVTAASWR